jgi:hypothetical protein
MELSDEMLSEISYVKISTYRTKVMKSLEDEVKIPSKIAEGTNLLSSFCMVRKNLSYIGIKMGKENGV